MHGFFSLKSKSAGEPGFREKEIIENAGQCLSSLRVAEPCGVAVYCIPVGKRAKASMEKKP